MIEFEAVHNTLFWHSLSDPKAVLNHAEYKHMALFFFFVNDVIRMLVHFVLLLLCDCIAIQNHI